METAFRMYMTEHKQRSHPSNEDQREASHGPNENKMSDGWRESASLRVEGGISSKVKSRDCQPFAPSHG
jgi:hypothetical protein